MTLQEAIKAMGAAPKEEFSLLELKALETIVTLALERDHLAEQAEAAVTKLNAVYVALGLPHDYDSSISIGSGSSSGHADQL